MYTSYITTVLFPSSSMYVENDNKCTKGGFSLLINSDDDFK